MQPKKSSVRASKQDRERGAAYARGGKGGANEMLPEQAANPQKPAVTGHDVKGAAPGAKYARGGPKNVGYGLSLPAVGGHTAPVRLGKGR
jgi:hypothetical protein